MDHDKQKDNPRMVQISPGGLLSGGIDYAQLSAGTITSSKLTGGGRGKVEAFIRIERAVNGRLVQVAKSEGEPFTTWLCKDDDDLLDTIKQALADQKV